MSSSALCRPLRDLDPINEPETTKQLGREAANEIERLREALEPFALYARLNDLGERDPDDAIEVPVRDLLAAVEALSLHKDDRDA